mgnify:FL=1
MQGITLSILSRTELQGQCACFMYRGDRPDGNRPGLGLPSARGIAHFQFNRNGLIARVRHHACLAHMQEGISRRQTDAFSRHADGCQAGFQMLGASEITNTGNGNRPGNEQRLFQ